MYASYPFQQKIALGFEDWLEKNLSKILVAVFKDSLRAGSVGSLTKFLFVKKFMEGES